MVTDDVFYLVEVTMRFEHTWGFEPTWGFLTV
jgi:hypothetical protein